MSEIEALILEYSKILYQAPGFFGCSRHAIVNQFVCSLARVNDLIASHTTLPHSSALAQWQNVVVILPPFLPPRILNAHLGGKTHIKKLEQAGLNSFLPPVPLGPIPATLAMKEEKWKTGEKRKFSEIDPTNKGHFTCEVCNLEFNSRVVYETHMQGKKHARMLKSIEEIKTQNVEVSCEVCNFVATSAVHLDAHLQGKNHKKRMEAAGKGVPGGTPSGKPKTDPSAPKMLAQMHSKKQKMDDSAEQQYEEEEGGDEYYDEGYGNHGGHGAGGGAHGGGAAGYYGY